MKILIAIALILAFVAVIGIVCLLWATVWYTFEDTKAGKAITEKIIERINK